MAVPGQLLRRRMSFGAQHKQGKANGVIQWRFFINVTTTCRRFQTRLLHGLDGAPVVHLVALEVNDEYRGAPGDECKRKRFAGPALLAL